MNRDTAGLGSLVNKPHYVPSNTRFARYAASNYRPVIYFLTTLIIVVHIYKYRAAPMPAKFGLVFAILGYTAVFIWRMKMKRKTEFYFYKPKVQFIRGQASIASVSIMIFLLAAHGYYDHMLWLLYVLATLLISEHNSTSVVLFTLAEVAGIYGAVSYLGWAWLTSDWMNIGKFWVDNDGLGSHILGIWLITFVFHYLVRNIHGRDKAFERQQKLLELATGQWMNAGKPHEQRAALVQYVENFTEAKVKLWIPRLRDGKYFNDAGLEAPQQTVTLAEEGLPTILCQIPFAGQKNREYQLLFEPPINQKAHAQIIIPIPPIDAPQELMAILDIQYIDTVPSEYKLEMDCSNLLKLIHHAQLILLNSSKTEQSQLEWSLSFQMHSLLNTKQLSQRVADDMVEQLGFDFATVSLVDDDEDLIRCVAGCNAKWVEASIHPMSGDDVQSQVIKRGKTILNNGKWKPYFDGRIWNRFKHARMSRVWVPIPDPSPHAPYPALGTIEAGFLHRHRKLIPNHLIHQLQQYAKHAGVALANAELHERTADLATGLTLLQEISREMQRAAAFYGPYQMIQLIGESAEKLLNADIITLYTFDEKTEQLDLAYKTVRAIRGKGRLSINLRSGLLHQLFTTRKSYYSSHARRDPILVNLKDGRLNCKDRTFTQRQNIKSVAGVPLTGKRDNIIGFLCINYCRRREFYAEFMQIIELFAEQATVALEETYEHRLARKVAIAQERNNLAAELHHALSQNLYGLKQYARTAQIYVQRNDLNRAMVNLNKVKESASWSLEELQDMLNYLHEYPNGHIDFVKELTEYIKRMKLLHPKTEILFNHSVEDIVSNQVQFYLLRIAREGINNALRHARSCSITIYYAVKAGGRTELTIQDDGIGFNVDKAKQSRRFGLGTMDYYARQINSSLHVISREGGGTCIQINVSPPPSQGD